MAGRTENGDKGGLGVRRFIQPAVPVLSLRPAKRRPHLIRQQKSALTEDGYEDGAHQGSLSGGFERPSHTIKIQLGELERDHQRFADSPALSIQTGSSVDVAPSPLPLGMLVPRQLSILSSQEVLPDASSVETLTQATSSRPSSTSPTLNLASIDPTSPQNLQPPVVELPPDAYISRSASLKISFLYQEDLDAASPTSTAPSNSPTIFALHKMSQPSTTAANLPSTGENAEADPQLPNLIDTYHPKDVPFIRPGLGPGAPMVSLAMHLAFLFDFQIHCDQQIMVEVPGRSSDYPTFESHKFVILRSPLLAHLLHYNRTSGNEGSKFVIPWPFSWFNRDAFKSALRHLYNDFVLSITEIEAETELPGSTQHITDWRKSQIMFAIVYWLSGMILQADAVAHQAEPIVKYLINFDTIATALQAVTSLCDHELFGGERDPADTPTTHRYRNFLASPPAAPIAPNGPVIPDPSPTILRRQMFQTAGKLGTRLSELVFTFLAKEITFQHFPLDLNLQQTVIKPLYPITPALHAAYLHHVPPIQNLQFGQLPPAVPFATPNPALRQSSLKNRSTSYIMLNLPFGNLKQAIRILRDAASALHTAEDIHVKEFVSKVVTEREVRRGIANGDPALPEQVKRANLAVWRVLGYEERVVVDEETGEWDVEAECVEGWAMCV